MMSFSSEEAGHNDVILLHNEEAGHNDVILLRGGGTL